MLQFLTLLLFWLSRLSMLFIKIGFKKNYAFQSLTVIAILLNLANNICHICCCFFFAVFKLTVFSHDFLLSFFFFFFAVFLSFPKLAKLFVVVVAVTATAVALVGFSFSYGFEFFLVLSLINVFTMGGLSLKV